MPVLECPKRADISFGWTLRPYRPSVRPVKDVPFREPYGRDGVAQFSGHGHYPAAPSGLQFRFVGTATC